MTYQTIYAIISTLSFLVFFLYWFVFKFFRKPYYAKGDEKLNSDLKLIEHLKAKEKPVRIRFWVTEFILFFISSVFTLLKTYNISPTNLIHSIDLISLCVIVIFLSVCCISVKNLILCSEENKKYYEINENRETLYTTSLIGMLASLIGIIIPYTRTYYVDVKMTPIAFTILFLLFAISAVCNCKEYKS